MRLKAENSNEVKWWRRNSDLLTNSLSFAFEIVFSAKHPIYDSISLNLYRSSSSPRVVIEFGFRNEENASELDSAISMLNSTQNEFKHEVRVWGKGVMGKAPVTVEVSIENPTSRDVFLKLFDIANELYPSNLSSKAYAQAVNDILFRVIPRLNRNSRSIIGSNYIFEKEMESGLIQQDEVSELNLTSKTLGL